MPDNYSGPSLDKSSADFRASVAAAFDKGSERMARIEAALQQNTQQTVQNAEQITENTQAIRAVHDRTDEMVQVFSAMKGGFQVLGWIGKLVKWAAPIIAAVAAVRQATSSSSWWPFN